MSTARHFFVRDGYTCNPVAAVAGSPPGPEYWTEERIGCSSRFQYHVYELAAAVARARRLRSGLDLGCGPAIKAERLLAPVLEELYLMDRPACRSFAAGRIRGARFIPVDLERCEISLGRQVDLIVCADVLEHLSDPSACLEFALRHLAPDGVAVFSTPEREVLRGPDCMNSPHPDHVREWNREEFRRLLEWKGFRMERQLLLPAERLSPLQDLLRKWCPGNLRAKHWRSCQVAVCRK